MRTKVLFTKVNGDFQAQSRVRVRKFTLFVMVVVNGTAKFW